MKTPKSSPKRKDFYLGSANRTARPVPRGKTANIISISSQDGSEVRAAQETNSVICLDHRATERPR